MSFPRYPKYKASGVEWLGDVPDKWSVLQLKRRCRLVTDRAETSARPVGLENIESATGRFIETGTEFAGEGTAFKEGDLLFGKLRPYLAKAWLADSAGEAVGDFHVIRPSPDVEGRFLQYVSLCRDFIDIVDGSTFGSKMPRASWEFMGGMTVTIPPLPEQRAIAAFLDRETAKIDALVAEQERLIELLAEKRQAVISHTVTKGLDPAAPMKPSGVEWLGDVPGHWSVGPLKHYWQITDCKHLTAEFVDDGYPLASIREVQGKWVSLDSAKRTTPSFYKQLIEGGRDPRPGDLIFSRNATVGEVAQVPSEHPAFAMGQDVVLLRRTDQSSWPDYLQFVIKSPPFSAQLDVLMIGSTFRRINVAEIATCVVPWPTSDEQRQISDYLNDLTARFDSATREAHVSIALLKERRSALISAAVTGQIDVRGLVPEAVA